MRRALLLIICLGGGGVVGAVGEQFSGNEWWYLAIPIAVAVGWLFVGSPENCVPRDE